MNDILNNLGQMGPVAGLLLFLNVIGFAVKQSQIETRWNVWILPVLGAIIYPFVMEYTAPPVDADGSWQSPYFRPILMAVMHGFIIGWGAVGANQALRLFTGASPETTVVVPPVKGPPGDP